MTQGKRLGRGERRVGEPGCSTELGKETSWKGAPWSHIGMCDCQVSRGQKAWISLSGTGYSANSESPRMKPTSLSLFSTSRTSSSALNFNIVFLSYWWVNDVCVGICQLVKSCCPMEERIFFRSGPDLTNSSATAGRPSPARIGMGGGVQIK